MRTSRSTRRAATLIEIILVVTIVAILGFVILPKFRMQAVKAREAKARANLEALRSAYRMWQFANPTGTISAVSDLVPGYVREIPQNDAGDAGNWVVSNNTVYLLNHPDW